MAGTKEGGKKASETIKAKYGDDFYSIMGKRGGSRLGVRKGFAANITLARMAGQIGGRKSRRGSAKNK